VADSEYLTVADLEGDGIQEILVGSGDEVLVFEPDGTLRPGWPQSVASADFPLVSTRGSPIVADVTGDERLEVIATNRKEVFVWSADGALAPGFPVAVDVLVRGGNDWITAADRDGDGKDEIICASGGGVQVVRGDGTELSDSHIDLSFGVGPAVAADVDGDGRAEIGLFAVKPRFRFRGNGFKGSLRLIGPGTLPIAESRTRAKFFPHPGMADLDGDGVLDLHVVQENRRKTRIWLRATTSESERIKMRAHRISGRSQMTGSSQMSFADLDHDGIPEGYTYQRSSPSGFGEDDFGYFVPFRYRGAGDPLPPLIHRLFKFSDDGGDRGRGIAVADVDGDGIQELVGGVAGEGCGVTTDYCHSGTTPPRLRRGVVVQRLDGRLLEKFPKPLPQIFRSEGAPSTVSISFGLDDSRASTPAVADLDGDGLKEIVWVDEPLYGNRVYVWNVEGTPGPLLADWPMYQHDPKHSNIFPVTAP
jgi:hypothetical protein